MVLQVAVSSPTAMGKGSSHHHHPPSLCETYLKISVSVDWLFFFWFTWGFQESLWSFSLLSPHTCSSAVGILYFCKAVLPVSSSMVQLPKAHPSACSFQQSGARSRASRSSSLHRPLLCRWQGLCRGSLMSSLDRSIVFGHIPKFLQPSTLLVPPPTHKLPPTPTCEDLFSSLVKWGPSNLPYIFYLFSFYSH